MTRSASTSGEDTPTHGRLRYHGRQLSPEECRRLCAALTTCRLALAEPLRQTRALCALLSDDDCDPTEH